MVEYKAGDIVEYTVGGSVRTVEVIARMADVKNGRPGFDGEIVEDGVCTGEGAWGYDTQVIRVVLQK